MERYHKTSDLLTKFACPFCNDVKEGETKGILTHISKHLEVIAAIVLPRDQTESADVADSEPSETSSMGVSSEALQVQISNVHSSIMEPSLYDIFEGFGQIDHCLVCYDNNGQSLGRALIQYVCIDRSSLPH
jgi:hypothetical protein